MSERSTHTEILRAGAPVAVGSVTLLPIERVVLHSERGSTHVWCLVAKEPYALVVRDAGGLRAVDADAMAVSFADLREKIPRLDALLASM